MKKKLITSILALPAAVILAYIIATFASQYAFDVGQRSPSLGFGAIGYEFAILSPAILLLAIICGALNLFIFRSTKIDKKNSVTSATRTISILFAGISALVAAIMLLGMISSLLSGRTI